MIQVEILENGLIKTYSDRGLKIRQLKTNVVYDIAIDVVTTNHLYEETDINIEESDMSIEESDTNI